MIKTSQHLFSNGNWQDKPCSEGFDASKCQLVLAFGDTDLVIKPEVYNYLKSLYPTADIVFSTTAGEIMDDQVLDETVVATAIQMDKTTVKSVETNISKHEDSYAAGKHLMEQLEGEDLTAVFIISDGTFTNGSELVAGFNESNNTHVPVTGGMAGDAARFTKTYTGLNAIPSEGNVIAVGFYGKDLLVGHGSFGGWDEFGPERTITRSAKNVLFEIDERNALDLYKEYLGDYVNELPGSALLFPLSIRIDDADKTLVRTILSVDEGEKSMTFAGNLPVGSKVRLMKANFDKLIEGSSTAATNSSIKSQSSELAILISCVGRKLILQERTDEEVDAAKEILGDKTCITGFYSYGELSPFNPGSKCELHNQTMTITTFAEL